jgi:hypothetical protein
MDRFYAAGVQHALMKLGGSFLGRITPALHEAAETTQMMTQQLPSKAKALKKLSPEDLAKKKFLAGSTGPW